MEDIILEQPEFQMPPEGEQLATLAGFEDLGDKETKYGTKHQVKLIWDVDGAEQWGWVNVNFHSMSNLYKIASALLQGNPPKRMKLADLIGKRCLITIRHYTGEDGKTKSTIDDYSPVKEGTPLPLPATDRITDADLPF